jgi:hypothetical protein
VSRDSQSADGGPYRWSLAGSRLNALLCGNVAVGREIWLFARVAIALQGGDFADNEVREWSVYQSASSTFECCRMKVRGMSKALE